MFSSDITSMIAILFLGRYLTRFDFSSPYALWGIRILYYTSNLLQLLAWYYVRQLIERKSTKKERTTMIEIVEPAKPFSEEPPKKIRMSIYEYDMAEAKKQFNSTISSLLLMSVMHFMFKTTHPLIIPSFTAWKSFFFSPVVKIRIFGYAAEGNLERPWKVPNPIGDFLSKMTQPEDQIKEDEKESRIEEIKEEEKEEIVPEKQKLLNNNKKEESVVASESENENKSWSRVKSRKPRKEE